jgi:tyrosyl-tRNA synthetase
MYPVIPFGATGYFGDWMPLTVAFAEPGLAKSKSESHGIIAQGGAYENHRPRTLSTKLTAADLASETVMVQQSGKRSLRCCGLSDSTCGIR